MPNEMSHSYLHFATADIKAVALHIASPHLPKSQEHPPSSSQPPGIIGQGVMPGLAHVPALS
jgi:hypothetical protein